MVTMDRGRNALDIHVGHTIFVVVGEDTWAENVVSSESETIRIQSAPALLTGGTHWLSKFIVFYSTSKVQIILQYDIILRVIL
jgi:hypothetical protein